MCLVVLTLLPGYSYSDDFGDIRLSYLEGDVQINSESTRDWVIASPNMPLYDGNRLWVPDNGKAEIQFRNGTAVRLKENTSADILTYDRDILQLYVNVGGIYVNHRDDRDNILQVNTPVATVRAYNEAIFKIDVLQNNYTYISVYRGTVYADYRDGRNTITEGTMLLIKGYFREEPTPLSSPDSWTRWNMERDRRLYNRHNSSRYLPPELGSYSYDFDTHGKWVYVRDYGYCWTPTVTISAGWAPYRHGRWTWIRGDYVWISYEPWGWVPYHYGRWSFSVSIGWFWVPPSRGAVYWGPGYVGWVHTPSYVSWVPLAPGETYYGYGYYGPHSVNLFNVNINKIVIKDKYRNAKIRDGFTVIHRDTFVTGRPEHVMVKENPFVGRRINVGRPDIAPERKTVKPVIRDVPERKLPPPFIKESDVRALKERHPAQRQRDPQMREKMVAPGIMPDDRKEQRNRGILPDRKQEITPQDRKMERDVRPLDRRPEIQDKRAPDDRMRERSPSDIRRDGMNQEQRQVPQPQREIAPPERGRQVAPPQDKSGKVQERQHKQSEKDSPEEKRPLADEEGLRDRGLAPSPPHRNK